MVTQIRLAYYCSGHGYGHATRVSAFASSLLSLEEKPEVYVISSAPTHIFSECIRHGAHYRYAEIDPIIAQPLAYKVDRQKSVEVLQAFLSEKYDKLAAEVDWLSSERIDCVLSDAAFLACEAATKACIPSILITNFTFDSVYSYLGAEISDCGLSPPVGTLQIPNVIRDVSEDAPISSHVLEPLVSQLLAGYHHADILLLLPGFIPIPSFFRSPSLPAPAWVDPSTNRFRPEIESTLLAFHTAELHPSIPFPIYLPVAKTDEPKCNFSCREKPARTVKYAPLLVRPASSNINTHNGRQSLLESIGIPKSLHDPNHTHILVVSFGGQTIRRPQGGISPSRTPSPFPAGIQHATGRPVYNPSNDNLDEPLYENANANHSMGASPRRPTFVRKGSTKIFIPGAPAPANNPTSPHSPNIPPVMQILEADRTLDVDTAVSPTNPTFSFVSTQEEEEPSLLPSPSWIAIICGVPSNWSISGEEEEEDLPAGFYIAPRDVYMPDLTAVADVLLGKLVCDVCQNLKIAGDTMEHAQGYGTVSESVAQSTPFVYVPRPLFVEEHGLRLLLEAEGTGVELSHDEYESGRWANKVEEAYLKGKKKRHSKNHSANEQEVKDLAAWVVERVRNWQHQGVTMA